MSVIKRVCLTIKQRMDILKDLDTASVPQVAARYNICVRTVYRIQKNAAFITQIAENKNHRKRKRMRGPAYPELERQLYSWFVERRILGDELSDALILEKAHQLRDNIASNSACKLSTGWLVNFKQRNNIHLVRQYGCKASPNEIAAHKKFISEFRKQIDEKQIDLECVYSMNETGLLWRALPSKTPVNNEEACVSSQKEKKGRVCIALCANATGTHKLIPFFIHKFQKPRTLINGTNELPVIYASQKSAWMDQQLFMDWFSHFRKSVQLFQLEKGICSKVILLVQDFEAHKLLNMYIEDSNIEIKYLPSSATSVIQPMDQVIKKTKKCFRHKLMQHVATYAGGTIEFYKKYSIKDCIHILANAWADITSNDIKSSWHKLLHTQIDREGEEEDKETNIVHKKQEIMSQISLHNVMTENITDSLIACNEKERRYLRKEEVRKEYSNEDRNEDMNEDKNENGNEGRNEDKNENGNEGRNEEKNKNGNGGRNENKYECTNENRVQGRRVEGAALRLQTRGIPLNAQERQKLENVFTDLEKYNDRATPAMRILVQSIKLLYLGENLHNRKEI